ncbi:hypothetical protein BDV96DRAFT_614294 [Lophiotrema nucula]|uniref:SWIM-type domain-containing protein n=1 Tax=Lophiotrema nucula TaxID=690887 RepID=A0A6A5YZA5_9PLEO|nr:hypothetical protein BDV96DRAFT_614294 [Lophiotrema nucula]
MSAEQLSKLTLGETMVTTRAGAARAQRVLEQESAASQASQAPSPSSSSIIEASSGRKYDVSTFDERLRKRAAIGLKTDDNAIRIKYCKDLGGEPSRYMFYIYDDISISIGGENDAPQCSCGANADQKACKHIFWMLDRLAEATPTSIKTQNMLLAEDGSTVQEIGPEEIINNSGGLGQVANGLRCILQDSADLEVSEVETEVADMLSAFEPSGALPSELKEPGSPFLNETSLKYRAFKNLLTKYAIEDRGFLIELQHCINAPFQTQVFFQKINDRVTQAFQALDDYVSDGPSPSPTKKLDVANCATELQVLVHAVADYHNQQEDNDSDSAKIAVQAAAALVKILDGVIERDFDAYMNTTWGAIAPEDPSENNLFVCLIGSPPDDGRPFVLDALADLPHDEVLRNHWDALSIIRSRLEQKKTPPEYMAVFNSIVAESKKRAAPDNGGSSSKRPMQ